MLMSCGRSSLGGSLARASAITYRRRVGDRAGEEYGWAGEEYGWAGEEYGWAGDEYGWEGEE